MSLNRCWSISMLAALFGVLALAAPTLGACAGDCAGDGTVTINELVTGVNIALGVAAVDVCPAFDLNGDGIVEINELIVAVNNALDGCPGPGDPTPTPNATRPILPTPTPTPIAACYGDCNGDGTFTIDELIVAVNIALGYGKLSDCPAGDANGDGAIDVSELITAVGGALNGCPVTPFPRLDVACRIDVVFQFGPPAAGTDAVRSAAPASLRPQVYGFVKIGSAAGGPQGPLAVSLQNSVGGSIAGVQNDITFDGILRIAASADNPGVPDCTANPAINKTATSFAFEPPGCSGTACTGIRAIVLSLADLDVIPNDSVLYTCNVDPAGRGSLPTCSNAIAGSVSTLAGLAGVAVDAAGNALVIGGASNNAIEITPNGTIQQIIDATGNGAGHVLSNPEAVAAGGDVLVAGTLSNNVFRITPDGVIQQIIDATGDGAGHTLNGPDALAVDVTGNTFVAGLGSNNVFRITPDGTVQQIIDASGDGAGHTLDGARALAVDATGNVFVAGLRSNNVFRITPQGVKQQIIDATGDGAGHGLSFPEALAVDAVGNVLVAGGGSNFSGSNNVLQLSLDGKIRQIIDATGDGAGHALGGPVALTVDQNSNVFVAGFDSNNVFEITYCTSIPGVLCFGSVGQPSLRQIIDATGDGAGHALSSPDGLAADTEGNLFVASGGNNTVFKVNSGGSVVKVGP